MKTRSSFFLFLILIFNHFSLQSIGPEDLLKEAGSSHQGDWMHPMEYTSFAGYEAAQNIDRSGVCALGKPKQERVQINHDLVKPLENPDYRVMLAALCTDEEADYHLLEWLHWHKLLGVEHVHFGFHNTKGRCADVLKEFIDSGFVTFENIDLPVSSIQSFCEDVQKGFYNRTIEKNKNVEWIGFLDVDEFTVLRKHDSLLTMLSSYDRAVSVAGHWHVMASNDIPEGKTMLESLTKTGLPEADWMKVFARPRFVERHGTHHVFCAEEHARGCVLENGVVQKMDCCEMPHSCETFYFKHFRAGSRVFLENVKARWATTRYGSYPLDLEKVSEFVEKHITFEKEHLTVEDDPVDPVLLEKLKLALYPKAS